MESNPIPKYFCMIHTEKSKEYTYKAIESFIKHTNFTEIDRFFLIDNDNSFVGETQGIEIVKNQSPKSFAENINQILKIAIENNSDFVLLSNDIIFTPNWLEPLVGNDSINIPLSNQQVTAKTDKFELKPLMDLADYIGNEIELEILSNRITTEYESIDEPKVIPYFCFYLPYNISSKVGLFDENFGLAGGEDIDYRLRAELEGYKTKIITKSYLLHFMGKSTWRGGETDVETDERNQKYYQYFISKWGPEMAVERFNF
jgi:GT2 family glycosyltransferase